MRNVFPALLLLFVHGPMAMQRAILDEKLPEVLHVLAETRPDSEQEQNGDCGRIGVTTKSVDLADHEQLECSLRLLIAALSLSETAQPNLDNTLSEPEFDRHTSQISEPIPRINEFHLTTQPSRAGPKTA